MTQPNGIDSLRPLLGEQRVSHEPITNPQSLVRLVWRIENYIHLLRAYGGDTAIAASHHARAVIADLFQGDAVITSNGLDALEVVVPAGAIAAVVAGDDLEAGLRACCLSLAVMPFETSDGTLLLTASGSWRDQSGAELTDTGFGASAAGPAFPAFVGERPGRGKGWSARYRADMAAAATVFASLAGNGGNSVTNCGVAKEPCGLVLEWQTVCNAVTPGETFYREALLRIIDGDGRRHSAGPIVQALERLGLCGGLDAFVVRSVLEELRVSPCETLGVNISAQSCTLTGFWSDIIPVLAADRALASRLVVEITETTAIPDTSEAVALFDKLRRLGVMIALDDFGAGFASIRQLIALAPHVVKIDNIFLRRAALSERDRLIFERLTGLAAAVGERVIVEGVETEEQSLLASAAGADWQQGHFWGYPRLSLLSPGRSQSSYRGSWNASAVAPAAGKGGA